LRGTSTFPSAGRAFGASSDVPEINYMMNGPVTISLRFKKDESGVDRMEFLDAGKNPPDGVIVHYHLAEKPEEEVKLTFLDADGNIGRHPGADLRAVVERGAVERARVEHP
jgi:hypothetical protein